MPARIPRTFGRGRRSLPSVRRSTLHVPKVNAGTTSLPVIYPKTCKITSKTGWRMTSAIALSGIYFRPERTYGKHWIRPSMPYFRLRISLDRLAGVKRSPSRQCSIFRCWPQMFDTRFLNWSACLGLSLEVGTKPSTPPASSAFSDAGSGFMRLDRALLSYIAIVRISQRSHPGTGT